MSCRQRAYTHTRMHVHTHLQWPRSHISTTPTVILLHKKALERRAAMEGAWGEHIGCVFLLTFTCEWLMNQVMMLPWKEHVCCCGFFTYYISLTWNVSIYYSVPCSWKYQSWIMFTSWSVSLWKYGSLHPQRFFLPLLFLQVGRQPFTRPLWSTQKMLDVEILGLVTDNCYSISSNVCFGLVWDTLQWWSLINPQQATASATTSIKHHSCHCSINKQLVEDGDTWTLIVNYWEKMIWRQK